MKLRGMPSFIAYQEDNVWTVFLSEGFGRLVRGHDHPGISKQVGLVGLEVRALVPILERELSVG
eukprot:9010424-Pyramimonas_sp.AAC.1